MKEQNWMMACVKCDREIEVYEMNVYSTVYETYLTNTELKGSTYSCDNKDCIYYRLLQIPEIKPFSKPQVEET